MMLKIVRFHFFVCTQLDTLLSLRHVSSIFGFLFVALATWCIITRAMRTPLVTARKRSLREGYVFTPVCDSVNGEGHACHMTN